MRRRRAIRALLGGSSGGRPLAEGARAEMAPGAAGLDEVRIHEGSQAVADLDAVAATSGRHIWFAPGSGPADRALLAHELAHVVQQGTGQTAALDGAGGDPGERRRLEAAADAAGRSGRAGDGRAATGPGRAPPRPVLQLQSKKAALPAEKEATLGEMTGHAEALPISGAPAAQPNYADRAFTRIASAPLGAEYLFYVTGSEATAKPDVSIPKQDFFLDKDPLAGFVVIGGDVFRTKAGADAVVNRMNKAGPGTNYVAYYMLNGVIFPTTLSETTLPVLVDNLRRKAESDREDLRATSRLAKDLLWWYVGARFIPRAGGAGVAREAARKGGGAAATKVAFDASRVADELVAAVQSIKAPGERMLAAAGRLSAMRALTAAQKVEVMLAFFNRVGFAIGKGGVVDEGAQLVMYSEDARYAFRFVKSTGEILYGKIDLVVGRYVWRTL